MSGDQLTYPESDHPDGVIVTRDKREGSNLLIAMR